MTEHERRTSIIQCQKYINTVCAVPTSHQKHRLMLLADI